VIPDPIWDTHACEWSTRKTRLRHLTPYSSESSIYIAKLRLEWSEVGIGPLAPLEITETAEFMATF
jgi:hypothetical protein